MVLGFAGTGSGAEVGAGTGAGAGAGTGAGTGAVAHAVIDKTIINPRNLINLPTNVITPLLDC